VLSHLTLISIKKNDVNAWAKEGVSQCIKKGSLGIPFSSDSFQDSLSRKEA